MTAPGDGGIELDEVVTEFDQHLWMPDRGALYALLATVAANRLRGDPVWTLLVGASSSGKSELANALDRLPEYKAVSTFTEPASTDRLPDGAAIRVIGRVNGAPTPG